MAKKKAAAAKPLSKAELVDVLAERTELSKKDISSVLDELDEVIGEQLGPKGPGIFNVPGLMKVTRQWKEKTAPRKMINRFTGEEITTKAKPAHYVVKVKPLKGLSDKVAGIKKKVD